MIPHVIKVLMFVRRQDIPGFLPSWVYHGNEFTYDSVQRTVDWITTIDAEDRQNCTEKQQQLRCTGAMQHLHEFVDCSVRTIGEFVADDELEEAQIWLSILEEKIDEARATIATALAQARADLPADHPQAPGRGVFSQPTVREPARYEPADVLRLALSPSVSSSPSPSPLPSLSPYSGPSSSSSSSSSRVMDFDYSMGKLGHVGRQCRSMMRHGPINYGPWFQDDLADLSARCDTQRRMIASVSMLGDNNNTRQTDIVDYMPMESPLL